MNDQFDQEIKLCQARLNDAYVALLATTDVIISDLRERLKAAKDVAVALTEVNAPWAKVCRHRLQEAIRAAEIRRPDEVAAVGNQDREAKILLSLPKKTDEAISEWLREMSLTEGNSDWLLAATRYALDRLRVLTSTIEDEAAELSAVSGEEARTYAAQLRAILSRA